MKNPALILLFVFFLAPCLHGQKVRYGQGLPHAKPGTDYPIKFHISAIHLRPFCSGIGDRTSCSDAVYVDTSVEGKKIELMGDWPVYSSNSYGLLPGDYQARFLKAAPKHSPSPIGEKYEIVFPDRTAWRGTVTGISE